MRCHSRELGRQAEPLSRRWQLAFVFTLRSLHVAAVVVMAATILLSTVITGVDYVARVQDSGITDRQLIAGTNPTAGGVHLTIARWTRSF